MMIAYRNSFAMLCDEEGDIDAMELVKKLEEEEEECCPKNREDVLMVRVRFPRRTKQDGEWQVNERRESESGRDRGEEKRKVAAVVVMEEEYVSEGRLLVEEITKGKQRMRRIVTKRKKKKVEYRKLKGFDRRSRQSNRH